MVMHRIRGGKREVWKEGERFPETFPYTECGRSLLLKGGDACLKWDGVDCKKCLAKKGAT